MRQPHSFLRILLWSSVSAVLVALVAAGVLTNITLRSVEKNLPNELLEQLHDLRLIIENLSEVVSAAELTKAVPSPENLMRLREKVKTVHTAVMEVRNTYVFDNLIQASAFHSVVAPAVADVQLWLSEGVSGYGPTTATTLDIVLSRISEAYQKAGALNHDSETTAEEILHEQRNRLDRFLFAVNLLFTLASVTVFIMILLLIRQHVIEKREIEAQAERQKAEAALKASEEKYRLLVENANDAIFIVQDEKIKFSNQKTLEILDYRNEELTDTPLADLVHPEDREEAVDIHCRRMTGENNLPVTHTFRIRNRVGREYTIELSVVKIDWEGRPATLNVARDITEQKKLEAQLCQAHKMEAVGTLAGGIAHDFNNLLQAVQGYAELLLMKKKHGEAGYRELQEISRAAKRGGELTRQLLTFSRKIDSRLQPTDLNQTVEHVRMLLERTIPKMIQIELHLTKNLWFVDADESQIEQILMNLAVNARDAMPEGGRFIIETKNVFLNEDHHSAPPEATPGEYVLLAVTDTGYGIDKNILEHIFDPFFTTKEIGKGTGLGLAMVYGIVKSHSGYITCHSKPGEGTTFNIYFPVVKHSVQTPAVIPEVTSRQVGSETILVVDDDDSIRELGEQILQSFGHTIISAKDGESALRIYRDEKDRIDLVILDLIMPGIGGRQCLHKLLEIDPKVKVIVASGHCDSGQIESVTEIGAKAFIKKPYDVRQMIKTVREVLDRDSQNTAGSAIVLTKSPES